MPTPALAVGTTVVAEAKAHLPGVDPMTQLVIIAVNHDRTLELAIVNGAHVGRTDVFHNVPAHLVFPA